MAFKTPNLSKIAVSALGDLTRERRQFFGERREAARHCNCQ